MKQLNLKHIIGVARVGNTALIAIYDDSGVDGGARELKFATRMEADRIYDQIVKEIGGSRS